MRIRDALTLAFGGPQSRLDPVDLATDTESFVTAPFVYLETISQQLSVVVLNSVPLRMILAYAEVAVAQKNVSTNRRALKSKR